MLKKMPADYNPESGVLSHHPKTKIEHKVVRPDPPTEAALNRLEKLDRLIYDMLDDPNQLLAETLLESVAATAAQKMETAQKSLPEATKNLLAQQAVWFKEVCSYNERPTVIFIEHPPGSGFLVYSDSRGRPLTDRPHLEVPVETGRVLRQAAADVALRRAVDREMELERQELRAVKFYDLDSDLREIGGSVLETNNVDVLIPVLHGKIRELYWDQRNECDRTPSINYLLSNQVPPNVKYQQAFDERAKMKSLFLTSREERNLYSPPAPAANGSGQAMVDVEDAGKRRDRVALMNERLYEIAYWLADLKANVNGEARKDIRNKVADLVRSFINDPSSLRGSYLNFALLGAPGTGKSQLAKSLGLVISSLGLLSTTNYFSLTAADLIGGYLGQTAIKTQKVMLQGLEGVTFIDEAYALSMNGSKYGPEAIAQIVGTLDKRKGEMVLMVAGYEHDMKVSFFDINPGMSRRIPYQWVLQSYTANDLMMIFESFFTRDEDGKPIDYYITEPAKDYLQRFLNVFYVEFTNQAGDVENIVARVKETRNILGRPLTAQEFNKPLEFIINKLKPVEQEEKKEPDRFKCVKNLSDILTFLDTRTVGRDELEGCEESRTKGRDDGYGPRKRPKLDTDTADTAEGDGQNSDTDDDNF